MLELNLSCPVRVPKRVTRYREITEGMALAALLGSVEEHVMQILGAALALHFQGCFDEAIGKPAFVIHVIHCRIAPLLRLY